FLCDTLIPYYITGLPPVVQALTTPGKLVYDPFVGTGSILFAAAHFGAMTMGPDTNIRVVRVGATLNAINAWSNFKQLCYVLYHGDDSSDQMEQDDS
ncbi:tRNA (Guanine(10)-N2)-methyltransferase-like protein, partial [Thalictrum thalictroides]